MIRTETLILTPAGSAGSATATGLTGVVSGEIMAIHLNYTSQPATTDVTIATAAVPVQTLLTRTDANTDAWFYPRVGVQDNTGAALSFDTTEPVPDRYPVDDHVRITIAQGDPVANGLIVTILYKG